MNQEITRIVNQAQGTLTLIYWDAGEQTNLTFMIDYVSDPTCQERSDTATVIKQTLSDFSDFSD